MALYHALTNAVPDATGTVTVWNGATTASVAATDLVRPSDWNSAHVQALTLGGNTAGQSTVSGTNIVWAGGNNITLSGNGSTVTIVGAAGGAGGVAVSAGAASVSNGTVVFSNSNGVTFGLNGSTVTASHNGLTSQSNQAFSAGAASSTFQTLSFQDSNGVSFSNNAGAVRVTHALQFTSNTSAITANAAHSTHSHGNPTLALTNLSGTTASNSNGLTLSLSAAAPGGGATPVASASNGSFSFTTLAFSNANNVTFGTSAGSIITASVAAPGAAAENNWFNLSGNTAGNSTASGSTIVLSAGNNVTLSATNGSVIRIDAGGGGAGGTATMWFPYNEGVNVLGQHGNGSLQFMPLPTPVPAALGELHVDRVVFPVYFSNASNSTGSATLSVRMGLYTKTSNSISLAYSTSISAAITYEGNNSSASKRGIRLLSCPWTTTIGDGRYYVGIVSSTATASTNCTMSQVLVSQLNSAHSGYWDAANNATIQWPLGIGYYTAATNGLPDTIAFSQINGTATNAPRAPSWFMLNGTA